MVRIARLVPGITSQVAEVDVLVDTGAMITTVHPRDAIFRLGIDSTRLASPGQWPNREMIQGVGGTATHYVVAAQYGFLHDDGSLQRIDGHVRIAQFRAGTERLPSLLGRDILQHFQLVTDWPNRWVLLRAPGSAP